MSGDKTVGQGYKVVDPGSGRLVKDVRPTGDPHYVVTVDIKRVTKGDGTLFAKGERDVQDVVHIMMRGDDMRDAVSSAMSHLNLVVEGE